MNAKTRDVQEKNAVKVEKLQAELKGPKDKAGNLETLLSEHGKSSRSVEDETKSRFKTHAGAVLLLNTRLVEFANDQETLKARYDALLNDNTKLIEYGKNQVELIENPKRRNNMMSEPSNSRPASTNTKSILLKN